MPAGDRDPIDALADAGRAAHAAEQRAADRAARRAVTAADRMAWLSTTWLGWFGCFVGGLVVWLATFAAIAALILVQVLDGPPPAIVQCLEWGTLVVGPWAAVYALRAAALAIGRARLSRELAWARALPFALDGLDAMLRAAPTKSGAVVVRFEHASAAELERLRDAARGTMKSGAEVRGDTVVISSRAFSDIDDMGPEAPSTNHPYLRWLHRLVDRLLAPMHARHPVRAVVISGASSSES